MLGRDTSNDVGRDRSHILDVNIRIRRHEAVDHRLQLRRNRVPVEEQTALFIGSRKQLVIGHGLVTIRLDWCISRSRCGGSSRCSGSSRCGGRGRCGGSSRCGSSSRCGAALI